MRQIVAGRSSSGPLEVATIVSKLCFALAIGLCCAHATKTWAAQVREFEAELYKYVDSTNPGLLRAIMEKKILDDALKTQLQNVIKEAKQQFVSQREAVAK